MRLNKTVILTIGITLLVGVAIGAIFFGGTNELGQAEGEHQHEINAQGLWTCSMHPQVRQAEAGSCPFCGMDLIPVSTDDSGDPTVLKMSNAAIQLANIQTTVVGNSTTAGVLRLNGKVKVDQRKVNLQTTHFGGRVEKLYKGFEGDVVRKGDKVASIYSPELVSAQEELIEAIGKTGKPLIVVQCTGRPVPSPNIEQYAQSLVYAWQSGTETGNAVGNLLFGHSNPSGKLTMTVPRSTGQIPIYYGRKPIGKMRAYQEYMPYKNEQDTPLYPFGFGLSYSQFEYGKLTAVTPKITENENLIVEVEVENTSAIAGQEVVQCYISRQVSSTTRPQRELKAFTKCCLEGHERKTVRLEIDADDLKFYGSQACFMFEKGDVDVFVGGSSLTMNSVTVHFL